MKRSRLLSCIAWTWCLLAWLLVILVSWSHAATCDPPNQARVVEGFPTVLPETPLRFMLVCPKEGPCHYALEQSIGMSPTVVCFTPKVIHEAEERDR
jgi:hypothetical protein